MLSNHSASTRLVPSSLTSMFLTTTALLSRKVWRGVWSFHMAECNPSPTSSPWNLRVDKSLIRSESQLQPASPSIRTRRGCHWCNDSSIRSPLNGERSTGLRVRRMVNDSSPPCFRRELTERPIVCFREVAEKRLTSWSSIPNIVNTELSHELQRS